jgi:Family of unknown function (DUF5677)
MSLKALVARIRAPLHRRLGRTRGYGDHVNQTHHDRAVALMELVREHLPFETEATGDADAWPLIGAALLSRATTTLDSMLLLQPTERGVDASMLGRSLYEHIVHLAWLGADPTAERIEEWPKDDLRQRLKADDDCRSVGIELFTPEQRARVEAQVASMTGNPLVLTNLAVAADKYWAPRITVFSSYKEAGSLRGLYAIAYRHYSGTAHPSYRGLNYVVEDITATQKRVVLEGPFEGLGPYGMATVLYALGLYVAAASVGGPTLTTSPRYPG